MYSSVPPQASVVDTILPTLTLLHQDFLMAGKVQLSVTTSYCGVHNFPPTLTLLHQHFLKAGYIHLCHHKLLW